MKDDDYDYIFKYIIIGDSCVGKTSLVGKFIANTFDPKFNATIGVDFSTKIIPIDDKLIKIQLWDTAGQESFKSIVRCYYRGAIGCIIVFDITNRKSFENLQIWFDDVNNYQDSKKCQILIIGNKSDLQKERTVSNEEVINFAKLNNVIFLECSAKNKEQTDFCFEVLTREVFKNIDTNRVNEFGYGVKKNKRTIKQLPTSYKSTCCYL